MNDLHPDEIREYKKRKRKEKGQESRKIRGYVFDEQTRATIRRLINKEVIKTLDETISTGKEAYVFKATTPEGKTVVAKIYKIETSSFHNMKQYITGDKRFENIRSNRRNIIFEWAKKEFRNLTRAETAGVRVPHPIDQEKNVLIMEYISEDGEPALPLRNQNITNAKHVYEKLVEYIARLYYKALLVHADLSEYNILYANKEPIIIDIGQGVIKTHPRSEEFLKRDMEKIVKYFNNIGYKTDFETLRKDIKNWEDKL